MESPSSKALEANIAEYRVDVTIDPKYRVIQEVMSAYDGLQEPLNAFLEELCHPRKNWQFIVEKARTFSLGYFYDLKTHRRGPDAVRLYVDVALEAIRSLKNPETASDAYSNLYLLLQRLIKDSGDQQERFLPVINYAFGELDRLPEEQFSLVAGSYYQVVRIGEDYERNVPPESDFIPLRSLLITFFSYTYSSWLSEKDPREWIESEISGSLPPAAASLFEPVSHVFLRQCRARLEEIAAGNAGSPPEDVRELLKLPGYGSIVDHYRRMPGELYDALEGEKLKHQCKLIFLFHSMNIPGLSGIHEETLREINRDIGWLIGHEEMEHVQGLIERTFSILGESFGRFPEAVLKSVLNMGRGVYKTDKSDLVHFFNEHLVRLGFQTPDFSGISNDWQIQSNLAHIQNIRTWMELIRLNPKWSKKLLSSLIIHLSLSGVLIKDTDLFPRDITSFLNSSIQPVYHLVKQLMRLFPAYFNEIGAEGRLRDISTEIDEICGRKDVLVHFLRKQSHVESSNRIISLIEAVFDFWRTRSKAGLKPYLPPNIYAGVEEQGPYIDGVNRVLGHIFTVKGLNRTADLLSLDDEFLQQVEEAISEEDRVDARRVLLAVSFYRLLNEKYCVDFCDVEGYLSRVRSTISLDLSTLRESLSEEDREKKISGLLETLSQLRDIILSPRVFEAHEDIYRKRHIAADIPSMYGSYREAKFDALGLTFRIESKVNVLFEELVEDFDLGFITHHTFYRIYKCLKLFNEALNVDGIPAREFESQIELFRRSLNIKLVTFTQYLDIFRGFTQAVRNIVSDYFHNIHEQNLEEISRLLSPETLLPKYLREAENRRELFHKVSEIFLRDTMAASLGIQKLDLFLTRVSNTLHEQAEKLPPEKHYLLLTYDPRNIVTSLSDEDGRMSDIVHLGNKGLNMMRMMRLGLPVPPCFIVTTEVFRCRALIDSYLPAQEHFRKELDRQMELLEEATGKKFGSPRDSLLVSVRSGSAISQPGMMDSYLNVGINEDIVRGIISQTGEAWFAWDCYRRFLQSFGMSHGLARDQFDAIIDDHKRKHGAPLKRDLTPDQMKDVALSYKSFIRGNGIDLTESPREQLYLAVRRVLDSWNSAKARSYRKIIGISDDWGTAVTVQAMVFGNLAGEESGSGVFFTHSPRFSPDQLRPWGDYTVGNQGEDVVSGLVTTYPVSAYQARMENRDPHMSLEKRFPEIYQALRDIAKTMVYDSQWEPQDIEFTFQGRRAEDLHILQTRNMEMRERKRVPSFREAPDVTRRYLGHGIGVSGGALSGRTVFSLEDITGWRKEEPDTPLILIRNDTVPDDIREISAADGLLTGRGGATSHAAIVANRLGKTCVVGCRDLLCEEKKKRFTLGGTVIRAGEFISIEGSEGSIYAGKMEISENND